LSVLNKFLNSLIQYNILIFADRDLQIGHRPANVVKDKKLNFITWEPYFCVLLQDEQTLTAYRSEELSVNIFI